MLAIVGGMPRGGTTYAARALNACGIPAEHERAFSGDPEYLNPSSAPVQVGWLGTAWFHRFRGRRILLARPPLNVIRSLDSRGWFGQRQPGRTVRAFLASRLDGLEGAHDPLDKMARFYIGWMDMGLRSCDEVWPVHEFSEANVDNLGRHVGAYDRYLPGLSTVSTNTNTAQDDFRDLDWDRLGYMWRALRSMAERLGVPMGYGDLEGL